MTAYELQHVKALEQAVREMDSRVRALELEIWIKRVTARRVQSKIRKARKVFNGNRRYSKKR